MKQKLETALKLRRFFILTFESPKQNVFGDFYLMIVCSTRNLSKGGKMKVQAIGDRVFIRLDADDKEKAAGIIWVSDYPQERTFGTVESVGEKVKSVKAGDRVFFHIFDDLEGPEEDVVVVRENSILGVMSDE